MYQVYPYEQHHLGPETSLIFHPIDYEVVKSHRSEYYLWSVLPDQSRVLIKAHGIPYVAKYKLPSRNLEGHLIDWSSNNKVFEKIIERCRHRISDHNIGEMVNDRECIEYTLTYEKPAYGYKIDETAKELTQEYLLLFFRAEEIFEGCQSIFNYAFNNSLVGKFKMQRVERQFGYFERLLAAKDISYCTWNEARVREIINDKAPDKVSRPGLREFYLDLNTIQARPDIEVNIEFRLAVLDLETNHRPRVFPSADVEEDNIYMCSLVVANIVSQERVKYCFTTVPNPGIPEPEDIRVYRIPSSGNVRDDEVNLINMVMECLVYHDPDFISGYNIYGFDIPYIQDRFGALGLKPKNISRLDPTKTGQEFSDFYSLEWASSGAGDVKITNFVAPGRIHFDMHRVVRAGGYKVLDFKLETIAQHLLNRGKLEVDHDEMAEMYQRAMDGDIQAQTQFVTTIAYCVEDSNIIVDLEKVQATVMDIMSLCSVARIPPGYVYDRGQTIRVYSVMFKYAQKYGFALEPPKKFEGRYPGGLVQEPVKDDIYPIAQLDFNSLYPSIIQRYNICHTTFIDPYYLQYMTPDQYEEISFFNCLDRSKIEEEDLHQVSGVSGVSGERITQYYVRASHRQGLVPMIEEDMLSARAVYKKLLKMAKASGDKAAEVRYDRMQKAVKVVANSTYGFCGSNYSQMPFQEGAAAITGMSREEITRVNDTVISKWPEYRIIYGDTDSTMFWLGTNDYHLIKSRAEELDVFLNGKPAVLDSEGQVVTPEVPGFLIKPLVMETEGIFAIQCLAKKWRAYVDYTPDGIKMKNGRPDLQYKGAPVVRRDSNKYTKKNYMNTIETRFLKQSIIQVYRLLVAMTTAMLTGQLDLEEWVITTVTLGGDYKLEGDMRNVITKKMAAEGRAPQIGERIKIIVIYDPSVSNVGARSREYSSWQSNSQGQIPDFVYYCSKGMDPHDDMFNTCFQETQCPEFINIGFQPVYSRCHPVSVTTPVKMITAMIKNFVSLTPQQIHELTQGTYSGDANPWVTAAMLIENYFSCIILPQLIQAYQQTKIWRSDLSQYGLQSFVEIKS